MPGALGCGGGSDDGTGPPAVKDDPPAVHARLSAGSKAALKAGGVGALGEHIAAAAASGRRDAIRLALDPAAQRVARAMLAGRPGGVVAFDVDDGRLRVVAAAGGVDPFTSLVPPGSTLKVLLAGAGLAEGTITTDSRLEGDEGPLPGIVNAGGERHGPLTVGEALVVSSNTAFVDLTERLGASAIERWLRKAGWGEPVAVDLPRAARGTSIANVPSMRTADGRYRDPDLFQRASVAQLALLAAAVADDGTLPRLTFAADGEGRPRRPVWAPAIARELRTMMRRAVVEGTGITMLDDDLDIAAKTGTMPRGDGLTQASVIAVAPAQDPEVAIAVSLAVPRTQTGASAAGPVVRAVLRRLLTARADDG